MDSLPIDVLLEIFGNLSYKFIFSVCCTCKHLYNIKNLIVNKRILLTNGYPRATGKCCVHYIPEDTLVTDRYENPDEYVIEALEYLRKNQVKLIKGDLIQIDDVYCHMDPECVFDGKQILNFESDYEDKCLPSEFVVITDGVPIDYWNYNDKTNNHYMVWVDISQVKQQCIDNIQYGILDGKEILKYEIMDDDGNLYVIFTYFEYDGEKYYIVLDDPYSTKIVKSSMSEYIFRYDESTQIVNLEYFRVEIVKNNVFRFYTKSSDYEIKGNVLYLDRNELNGRKYMTW